MKKIGFFFGAGAEIPYGMPSGGKFALNIFKNSVDAYKEQLKEALKKLINLEHMLDIGFRRDLIQSLYMHLARVNLDLFYSLR